MWVRGAAIRPVPAYAHLSRGALETASRLFEGEPGSDRLAAAMARFEAEQPDLSRQVNRVLDRPLDETAKALGSFLCLCIWLAFSESFGARLAALSKDAIAATDESIRVEEELRREHAEEPLDLEDVVLLEQPHVVEWVHEHVDAATDLSREEGEGEVDVDDLHLVYRTALAMSLSLSYGVSPPEGERIREIMA
jgi:hypothetical protein